MTATPNNDSHGKYPAASRASASSFPPNNIPFPTFRRDPASGMQGHQMASADGVNASLNKSASSHGQRNNAVPTGADDRLAGQRVTLNGLSQPIKPYHKTMAALRTSSFDQAFAPRSASTYITDSASLADKNSARTHLEVYFPIRHSKESKHDSRDCQNLCRGQPHKDVQPVCRFCRKNIGPNYRDQVGHLISALADLIIDGVAH